MDKACDAVATRREGTGTGSSERSKTLVLVWRSRAPRVRLRVGMFVAGATWCSSVKFGRLCCKRRTATHMSVVVVNAEGSSVGMV